MSPIPFTSNARPTLGVEWELSLVDVESRRLVNRASMVLDRIARDDGDPHPKIKHELFESSAEIITGVCDTVADAGRDLASTLTRLLRACDAMDIGVIACGTHPFSDWRSLTVSPDPRYAALIEQLQWTARRLAISGAHFHVGMPSGDAAIAVANDLRRFLPIFLALSSSSPFYDGVDTGLASARIKVFESLPTAGLHPPLADWSEFEAMMDTLLHSGSVRSVREVWWDIRPHPDFGTVELRMCDAPSRLDHLLALAALAQSSVHYLTQRYQAGDRPPPTRDWVVRENRWRAARFGIDAVLIVDDDGSTAPLAQVTDDILSEVASAASELACDTELRGISDILRTGTGSQRQRKILAETNDSRLVVDDLVRTLRSDVEDTP